MRMLKWITPMEGQELTDIAFHLVWEADPEASSYEIKIAADRDFLNAQTVKVQKAAACEVDYYIPAEEKLPAPGVCCLKVISDSGKKTDTLHIVINGEHTKAPLKTVISPEHPYITIFDYSQHRYGAEYDILPEELKPYAAIKAGSPYETKSARLAEVLLEYDRKGYPWHLGASGPKEIAKGRYVVTPLSTIEYVFQRARNIKGVGVLEQYMGVRNEGDWRIPYFNRLIMLCGKYGIPFLYTDGNRNYIDLPAVTKRSVYMDVMREYSEYCVISYKQNHSHASYSCYGAILGAWMDGAAGHIGIQAENWYWNDAGFCDDPGHYYGYLQGNEQQIPAAFTAQMLLAGVSLGACYYSLEGEGWLMQMRNQDQYEYSPQGIAVLSMLASVVKHGLIPDKKEVLSKIKAVVYADGQGKDWGDAWTGGTFRTAFQNLYDIHHTKELFPKQLRYFYLPTMTDRKETFAAYPQIDLHKIESPDQMNEILNPLYPKWFEGDAYVTNTGHTYVIMNSNENTDCSQYYRVLVSAADGTLSPVTEAAGAIGMWQYFILWSKKGRTFLHLNAPADTAYHVFLKLRDGIKPEIQWKGEGVSAAWDAGRNRYRITMEGNRGPAELVITDGADARELLAAPLRNEESADVFLSDREPVKMTAGDKGRPAINCCANLRYGKLPISMNSIRYPHGISLPRNTEVVYSLKKEYTKLDFTLGFDIDAWMPIIVSKDKIVWDRYTKYISMYLKVYGDGKLIYSSPKLTKTNFREAVCIDVTGIDQLAFAAEGEIIAKPLVGTVTGTGDEFELDIDMLEDSPGIEAYLDIGNPILSAD